MLNEITTNYRILKKEIREFRDSKGNDLFTNVHKSICVDGRIIKKLEKEDKILFDSIVAATSFLDKQTNISIRVKAILQDIYENEICGVCGCKKWKTISDAVGISSPFFKVTCGNAVCVANIASSNITMTEEHKQAIREKQLIHKQKAKEMYNVLLQVFKQKDYKTISIAQVKAFIENIKSKQKGNGKVVRECHYVENKDELCTMLELTQFVEIPNTVNSVADFNWFERMHCIEMDYRQKPVCKYCGRPVKFLRQGNVYAESCVLCAADKYRETIGLETSNQLISRIEAKHYKVLHFPTNSSEELVILCKKCNHISKHKLLNGRIHHGDIRLCNQCDKYVSFEEKEIRDYISSLDSTLQFECNDRTAISPYELDVFIPSKKIAIEFDGLHWHDETTVKPNYHLVKMLKCYKRSIKLLTIFEDEWVGNKEIAKDKIARALGYCKTVDASKVELKEISRRDANMFFAKNDFKVPRSSSTYIGAFIDGELLFTVAFAKIGNSQLEVVRYCSKIGIEGFSLLQEIITYVAQMSDCKSFCYFNDNRWNDATDLEQIGFVCKKKIRQATYWYKKTSKIVDRLVYPMEILKNGIKAYVGERYDISKSEIENMHAAGYVRVFDCGSMKMVKSL